MDQTTLLLLLAPILLVDLSARAWCLYRLAVAEPESIRGPKGVWVVVILLVNFGWVAWLLAGRKEA